MSCDLCKQFGITCERNEGFMGFGETRTVKVDGKTYPKRLNPILECQVLNGEMTPKEAKIFLSKKVFSFRKFTQFP